MYCTINTTRNKGSKFLTGLLLPSIYTRSLPSGYKFDSKYVYEGHSFPSACFSYRTTQWISLQLGLFRDVTLCTLVDVYRRFQRTCCLYLLSRRYRHDVTSQDSNLHSQRPEDFKSHARSIICCGKSALYM
jgi:hypothetical protein